MSNIEQQHTDIFTEVDTLQLGLDPKADASFRARFAKPTTVEQFVNLVECLLNIQQTSKRDWLTTILTDCLYIDPNFCDVLYLITTTTIASSDNYTEQYHGFHRKFVDICVSLPELMSNLYGRACPNRFSVKNYTERLCLVIFQVLKRIHSGKESFKLNYIRHIIRRLCFKGYTNIVWEKLMNKPVIYCLADQKWLLIMHLLLLPDNNDDDESSKSAMYLESMLKMILSNAPCYRVVDQLLDTKYIRHTLGNKSVLISKMEFLMTNKFLFIFHCSPFDSNGGVPRDRFLLNMLAYMYQQHPKWLIKAMENVLNTWANSSAFKFRSYAQHFYLARILIICTKLLFEYNSTDNRPVKDLLFKCQTAVMYAIEMHLSCTQTEMRTIGLTSSRIVMNIISAYRKIKVKMPTFDEEKSLESSPDNAYLEMLETLDLTLFFEAPPSHIEIESHNVEATVSNVLPSDDSTEKPQVETTTSNSVELDSDDDDEVDADMQPYDLSIDTDISHDVHVANQDFYSLQQLAPEELQNKLLIDNSAQIPIYLQDCIDGLIQTEKLDWQAKCLRSAEKIIRANFPRVEDLGGSTKENQSNYGRLTSVGLHFAQILFNLDNNLAIEQFNQLRLGALIALCVGVPQIVAQYLSKQFYTPYLSIEQRLDVLTVLSMACDELSQLKPLAMSSYVEMKEHRAKIRQPCLKSVQFRKKYFTITHSNDGDSSDSDDEQQQTTDWNTLRTNRIQSKTRYISSHYALKRSQPDALTDSLRHQKMASMGSSSNRFVSIAHYFYFPLIRDPERMEVKLRVREEDSYLLERLIQALAFMLTKCANYPQVNLMAKELLEFLASFRYHNQRKVRFNIIMALHCILESTPTSYLFNELKQQLFDFQLWLNEIAFVDVDSDCAETACVTLNLMQEFARV